MASQSRLDEPADSPAQRRAGAIARMFDRRRLLTQFLLLANRAAITAAKFLLAVYTARYLGLADLGIYGLLVAGTTIVPAVAGFGMTDWIVRRIVDLPTDQALPLMACRSSLTICVHLVVQPLLLLTDVLLGEPIPLRLAALGGLILMLDNLNSEASDMLVARRHILLANGLTFLRAGLWPLLVIAVGLVFPQTRTLQALLIGWAALLVVSSLVLAGLLVRGGRWRHMRPQWGLIVPQLSGSRALYVKDVSGTLGIFVDRFIISVFLGLELTGVYTFFWSITNVVHSLALVGMLLAQIASLLAAGRKADKTEFHAIERSLQIEIGAWTLLLSLGVAVATPLLLPYLGRPLLENYLFVFWIILFATILRIAADGYGYALLALNRDTEIAIIAFARGDRIGRVERDPHSARGIVGRGNGICDHRGGIVGRPLLSHPAAGLRRHLEHVRRAAKQCRTRTGTRATECVDAPSFAVAHHRLILICEARLRRALNQLEIKADSEHEPSRSAALRPAPRDEPARGARAHRSVPRPRRGGTAVDALTEDRRADDTLPAVRMGRAMVSPCRARAARPRR